MLLSLAAVVAQRYSTRLMIERSWVPIPPGAELFFLYPISCESLIRSLIEVQHC